MNTGTSTTTGTTGSGTGTSGTATTGSGIGTSGTATTGSTTTNTTTSASNVGAADASNKTDADNTRVNKRDRKDATTTPMDQGGSETDRKITQQIRKAVMDDKSLSFSAKNVKIITTDGKVTLRGTVKNDQERAAIEAAAQKVAGQGRIDNQIEVERK
jgi:osmotically-inducible protein OsmY